MKDIPNEEFEKEVSAEAVDKDATTNEEVVDKLKRIRATSRRLLGKLEAKEKPHTLPLKRILILQLIK